MLTNNLKLAFRQLSKHRTYALLNVLGLAIGIAASLLIYRILRYELSFNHNFEQHERIVRFYTQVTGGENGLQRGRGLPLPAMEAIANKVPTFEYTTRLREDWPTITVPDPSGGAPLKKIKPWEAEISFFAEPAVFKVFDFKWLAGDPATALKDVGDLVLTRKVAEHCFGNVENALGKAVELDNNVPCTVIGVIENLPDNCDFPLFSLASYATLRAHKELYYFEEGNWGSISSNDQLFGLLHDKNQFDNAAALVAQVGLEEMNKGASDRKASFGIQSLKDMHYDEETGSSGTHTISQARLWVLGSIGFLVLLMACFNFINLATALASLRAKEVGVRKAVGGARGAQLAHSRVSAALASKRR